MRGEKDRPKDLIIAGAGGVGDCIIRMIAHDNPFERVFVADYDQVRAQGAAERHGFIPVQLDANDPAQVRDLLLNAHSPLFMIAVAPSLNRSIIAGTIMAAQAERRHVKGYIDMAMTPSDPRKHKALGQDELRQHAAFERHGIIGVTGAGADPGWSQVAALIAMNQGLKTTSGVHIEDGSNVTVRGEPAALGFNLAAALQELTRKFYYYKHGRRHRGSAMSAHHTVDFGDPVGAQTVVQIEHEELMLFLRDLEDQIGLSVSELLDMTYSLGLSELHIRLMTLLRDVNLVDEDTELQADFSVARTRREAADMLLQHPRVRQSGNTALVATLDEAGLYNDKPVRLPNRPLSPAAMVARIFPDPARLGDQMEGASTIQARVHGIDWQGRQKTVVVGQTSTTDFSRQKWGTGQVVSMQTAAGAAAVIDAIRKGHYREPGLYGTSHYPPQTFADAFVAYAGGSIVIKEEMGHVF